jgi:hypothetical protein
MTEELDEIRSASVEEARAFRPGARHYRSFVGSPKQYDVTSAAQFSLMTALGLREDHRLLDIGCGSLCGGRLFIPYLKPDRYHGIEPQQWLVDDGVRFEVTAEMQRLKRPRFRIADDFPITEFGVLFDFMLAHSVLTHVSPRQLDRCLSQAKLGLAPRGLFAASFYCDGGADYAGDAWKYPDVASYAPGSVAAKASEHGLVAHPFLWHNNYGHYWLIFAHRAHAESAAWLANVAAEQSLLRILALERALSEANERLSQLKRRLEQANSELSTSRGEREPKS